MGAPTGRAEVCRDWDDPGKNKAYNHDAHAPWLFHARFVRMKAACAPSRRAVRTSLKTVPQSRGCIPEKNAHVR